MNNFDRSLRLILAQVISVLQTQGYSEEDAYKQFRASFTYELLSDESLMLHLVPAECLCHAFKLEQIEGKASAHRFLKHYMGGQG